MMAADTASRAEYKAMLLTGAAVFVLALMQTLIAGQEGDSPALRVAGALLLGILLQRRPALREVAGHLGLGVLAFAAGRTLAAGEPVLSLAVGGIRIAEVGLAYVLLRTWRVDPVGLRDVGILLRTSGIVIGIAPLLGAALSGVLFSWLHATDFRTAALTSWVASAFGSLVVLPVVLAWTGPADPGQRRHGAAVWLAAAATVAICLAAMFWLRRPFVVLLLPLLAAALRLGVFRTALLGALTVLLVIAVERYLPQATGVSLAQLRPGPLSFTEAAFYSALVVIAPLLVSIVARQREKSQALLLLAHEQLQQIADNVPALIARLDAAGRYRFVNRQFEAWLGKSGQEALGHTPQEVFGEDYGTQLDAHVTAALAGRSGHFEMQAGAERVLEISYEPYLHQGQRDGYLVLARDISRRKAAERALFEEKERAQITLDSIGDAVVCCDPELRVTRLNPVAAAMTGWSEPEALGQPVDEVVCMLDVETGNAPLSPLRVALENDRVVALQHGVVLVRRDGMQSPIEDSAAPIHDRDGRVVGAVMVFHDVSESRAMALKMSHLAQHDYLTDLPNRVLLQDRVQQALAAVAQGSRGALLFVDLDHFKIINDSLGHPAGDLVLQEVARRLVASVRVDDTVSRQGGDEFVVLLQRLHDPRDAARVAEKMLEAMAQPILVEGHALQIGLSIGIALFPQDATEIHGLTKQADTALYHAKQAGRGRYSYFVVSMSEKADQRLQLEHALRQALRDGGLYLVYQPKVAHRSGRIAGMEALVRWRNADGRIVPPSEFIPVAEDSGLILQLDEWVMREAVRQNKAWQEAGAPQLPVAVNVSLARFDPERLLRLVSEVLAESGLPPHCLELEFTESQMFSGDEEAWRLIEGLRGLGVRVAIDDFGTGYSNLSYLARYQFDTLKIDQSFIRELSDGATQDAIVQAIIAMAKALNARVVAEGVETEAQARVLELYGCQHMQGYLYSRPLPAAEFRSLLAQRTLVMPEAAGG